MLREYPPDLLPLAQVQVCLCLARLSGITAAALGCWGGAATMTLRVWFRRYSAQAPTCQRSGQSVASLAQSPACSQPASTPIGPRAPPLHPNDACCQVPHVCPFVPGRLMEVPGHHARRAHFEPTSLVWSLNGFCSRRC